MSAFFQQVPKSIEEAALVDGCSKMRSFLNVALPVTRPGVITTAVLCLVFSWNDYAFASALGGPSTSTLPMAAGALVTQSGIDWGLLSALGVVVATPMLIAGLAVRRHLVTGLSLGAVTGE
jgi:multiple sugar transport system permease protein